MWHLNVANCREPRRIYTWSGKKSEQGVAIPSSVLRSRRAAEVNIEIIEGFRAVETVFVRLYGVGSKADLLERKSVPTTSKYKQSSMRFGSS